MSYSDNKYNLYQIEDWVVDDDFISFVNGSVDEEIEKLSGDPKHAANIEKARIFVTNLNQQAPEVDDSKLDEIFESINRTLDQKPVKRTFQPNVLRLVWITGVAASIALLLFFLPGLNSTQEFVTNSGEVQQVILPDHSVVELNNKSELKFSGKNWDRQVQLEGEAFFKVEKGSTFTVQSEQGKVSVLGTQFNVYDRRGFFEVECLEGKVEVALNSGEKYILNAGDKLSNFNKSQVPVVREKVVQEIDWLNKFVTIDSMDLGFVFGEVERYYDVEFQNEDQIRTKIYEGFFSTSSLDSAMYQILWPLGIDYAIEGNKVIIK